MRRTEPRQTELTIMMSSTLPTGVCRVETRDTHGHTNARTVRVADVAKLLSGVQADQGGEVWVDLLSSPWAVATLSLPGDRFGVIFVEPAQTRTLQWSYRGRPHTSTIDTPPLLWGLGFQRYQLFYSALFCVDRRPMSVTDSAARGCVWPMGNVYPDGHICWGEVQVTVARTNPTGIVSQFFGSPFNMDLYLGGTGVPESPLSIWSNARQVSALHQVLTPQWRLPLSEIVSRITGAIR